MYENLMPSIGPKKWSTNFNHKEFYDISSSNDGKDYYHWSKEYQPGYMFRNLGNEKIYFNNQTKRLLQNYRSAYVQLAFTYYMDYQKLVKAKKSSEAELSQLKEKILSVLDKMEENIPGNTIPIQSEDLHYQVSRIYGDLGDKEAMKKIMIKLIEREGGKPLNKVDYANTFYRELNDTEKAINTLEGLRAKYLQMEAMIRARGFNKKTVKKGKWNRWEKAYPDIVSSLVYIYRENNMLEEAEIVLGDWVQRNPRDKNAQDILNQLRTSE